MTENELREKCGRSLSFGEIKTAGVLILSTSPPRVLHPNLHANGSRILTDRLLSELRRDHDSGCADGDRNVVEALLDEVGRLRAIEARLDAIFGKDQPFVVEDDWTKFADRLASAVAEEREACARICDEIQKQADKRAHDSADPSEGADGAQNAAELIRARSAQTPTWPPRQRTAVADS